MSNNLNKWTEALRPYKGIIYFIVLLFGTHFLWKLVVNADLHSQQIAIFGINMTPLFYRLSQLTAQTIHWFVSLFPNSSSFEINDTYVYFFGSRIRLSIIWGCTGIKQSYIFITIMLFYSGPWKQKLWYIPMGCILLQAYNIFRIACIAWLTQYHPERFDFLHEGVFRYIYYGLIFLLWVIWEEKFVNKQKKALQTEGDSPK